MTTSNRLPTYNKLSGATSFARGKPTTEKAETL